MNDSYLLHFTQTHFKELDTDWINNKPEFFKIWFDENEEWIANKEWDKLSMPDGWSDEDFAYWKNDDPWGLKK